MIALGSTSHILGTLGHMSKATGTALRLPCPYGSAGLSPPSSSDGLEFHACSFPRLELHSGSSQFWGISGGLIPTAPVSITLVRTLCCNLAPMVPLDTALVGTLCGDFTSGTSFFLGPQAIHDILWNLGRGIHAPKVFAFLQACRLNITWMPPRPTNWVLQSCSTSSTLACLNNSHAGVAKNHWAGIQETEYWGGPGQ